MHNDLPPSVMAARLRGLGPDAELYECGPRTAHHTGRGFKARQSAGAARAPSVFHSSSTRAGVDKNRGAYLPKVQDALERLAIGTREVFGQQRTSALTVRCAVSFAVNWLGPRLTDFLDRHPHKPVRILSSVWTDAFDQDDFDLDIHTAPGTGRASTATALPGKRLSRFVLPPCPNGLR